jgi:hypothetical protein
MRPPAYSAFAVAFHTFLIPLASLPLVSGFPGALIQPDTFSELVSRAPIAGAVQKRALNLNFAFVDNGFRDEYNAVVSNPERLVTEALAFAQELARAAVAAIDSQGTGGTMFRTFFGGTNGAGNGNLAAIRGTVAPLFPHVP